MDELKKIILDELSKNNGILRLNPAWVARDFLPPGRRLGLPENMYDLGERGGICERWVGSTTKADNKISVPNEGLSILNIASDAEVTLKDAIDLLPGKIMGEEYSKQHEGLGRLPKIFDYKYRLPYHIHQMDEHAKLVGCNSKEEAYYFPEGVPMGVEAETYFGVHPYIVEKGEQKKLLSHLINWSDDQILQHARAYMQIPGDGFHVPSGTLHAPGSALTIELQEDSDVFAMMQAKVGGKIIDKELLFKDVRKDDREKHGEKILLEMVNWEVSGDPYFYENRHTPPILIEDAAQPGGNEFWIFYNTNKFSGKKIVVKPNSNYTTKDEGVYNILVWKGKGVYGGLNVEARNFGRDELLVTYQKAVDIIQIENTGNDELVIYKFFGPDINSNIPMLPKYEK